MHERLMSNLEELCEFAANDLDRSIENIKKAGGELDGGKVDYLDKLTHMIKSVKATMRMMEDDGHSYMGAYGGYSRSDYNRRYSQTGHSYARGRNAPRDSMGRYSRNSDNMMDQLRDIMNRSTDEQTRQEIQRMMDEMRT